MKAVYYISSQPDWSNIIPCYNANPKFLTMECFWIKKLYFWVCETWLVALTLNLTWIECFENLLLLRNLSSLRATRQKRPEANVQTNFSRFRVTSSHFPLLYLSIGNLIITCEYSVVVCISSLCVPNHAFLPIFHLNHLSREY